MKTLLKILLLTSLCAAVVTPAPADATGKAGAIKKSGSKSPPKSPPKSPKTPKTPQTSPKLPPRGSGMPATGAPPPRAPNKQAGASAAHASTRNSEARKSHHAENTYHTPLGPKPAKK